MNWEMTIGLETHVQLNTATKIFSSSSTQFGAMPNTQANEVDMALPGILPVLNRNAVEKAVLFGLAVKANIARVSQFERKHYFYPDLPKAYQITQCALPIVSGGQIHITTHSGKKTIQLTRAHLEEDAGKSIHDRFNGQSGIDLNRAGIPLIEVVTEPVMHSSEEAVAYAKALYELVTWLNICDGNMQEGSFRCDANVSVRKIGDSQLGTRREIKNLNSFKFLQQAIDYEASWQIEQLESGNAIVQATVLFDSDTGQTYAMRNKEDAHDYRYFPDPDLPPLELNEIRLNHIRKQLPVLPIELRTQFMQNGLSEVDALILTQTKAIAEYYQAVATISGQWKLAANWVMGEVSAALNRQSDSKQIDFFNVPVSSVQLGCLIKRIADHTINHTAAKQLFVQLWKDPSNDPYIIDQLIELNGLKQVTDTAAIETIIDTVLSNNLKTVSEFKSGKLVALNALVGQCMKLTKGKASPAIINELLKNKLQNI